MRRLLLLVLVAGCYPATEPQPTGTIIYRLNRICQGGAFARDGTFRFSIDGRVVGTAVLLPDSAWSAHGIQAGDHLVSAAEINLDFPQFALRTWAPEMVSLRPDGTVLKQLAC